MHSYIFVTVWGKKWPHLCNFYDVATLFNCNTLNQSIIINYI